MDSERFERITAGIQSLAVTGALLVGGVWTLKTFRDLKQADRASVEIRELDLRSRHQAIVEITVLAEPLRLPTVRAIHSRVTVRNSGNRNVRLSYSNPAALVAAKVSFKPDGTPSFSQRYTSPILFAQFDGAFTENVLRSGETTTIPFVTPVAAPGLYLVTFCTQPVGMELSPTGEPPGAPGGFWTGSAFVLVP